MDLDYKRFLLFGDSITEFSFNPNQFSVGAALTHAYARKLDVVQRGYSGYNSRWGLKILKEILNQESGIIVSTLFFGANDLCIGGHQRVPLEEFIWNTREMIKILHDKGIKPIVIGPGMIDRERWEASRPDEIKAGYVRTNEDFQLYSDALVRLTEELHVPYINLNILFRSYKGDFRDLFADGLHFSGSGYKILFNELIAQIGKFYPDLLPENLPYHLPYWRDVLENGSNL